MKQTWVIGCETPEWREQAERAVRQFGLRAYLAPSMKAVVHEPPNPPYHYLLESENVTKALDVAVAIFRQWFAYGIGTPHILHLASTAFWERVGNGGELILLEAPHPIYQVKMVKESALLEHAEPEDVFRIMGYFTSETVHVETWYMPSLFSREFPEKGLMEILGIPPTYIPYPHPQVVNHSVLLIAETQVGELLARAFEIVWKYNLWHRPRGLVALAPAEWHSELRRAQVEGRPLFLDICTPEQLRAEGAARVAQWRAQLQAALEAFYAEWAAKLPLSE